MIKYDLWKIPNTIKYLRVGNYFIHKIINLPIELTHLELCKSVYEYIDEIPNTVTHLILSSCYNQVINYLPNTIQEIEIHRLSQYVLINEIYHQKIKLIDVKDNF